MRTINIAKDFTRYPAGRFKKNGDTSGEAFRERFLLPALSAGENITVEMDGTIGYGSSFLEEAFGGTVRALNITSQNLLSKLTINSKDATLIKEIHQYIEDAGKRLKL